MGCLVDLPEEADFFLLPFKYEIIHDFTEIELSEEGLSAKDLPNLQEMVSELDELSVKLDRKLIVFFYRDPEVSLNFRNALIFRTSTRASWHRKGEFGLPAFLEDFGQVPSVEPNTWKPIPRVSFRGTAAPIKLPAGILARDIVNQVLQRCGLSFKVKNWYNEGYLLRRKAMLSINKKAGQFGIDFLINQANQFSAGSVKSYWNSLQDNDYFICTRGHGNYSFRLYEIMRAGRIPVFIQTDSLLPAPESIPWKDLTVWIEASEVRLTADKILDFHHSLRPDEFVELQLQIRRYWEKYLTYQGFADYLLTQFLPENRSCPSLTKS